MTRSRKQPEGNIQDAIRELIAVKYRWRHRRNNVHGPAQVLQGRGVVKCGTKGEADLTVYVPWAQATDLFRILHVEVKKPGEYQTPEQKDWQQTVEKCGEYYAVCRSQEDFEEFVRGKGWAK